MTRRSSLLGMAGGRALGEARVAPFSGPPLVVDPDGSRWLRPGNLVTYTADYSNFLAAQPGLTITAMPTRTAGFTAPQRPDLGARFFSSVDTSQNMLVSMSNSGPVAGIGTALTYSNTGFQLTSVIGSLFGAFKHAGANVVIFYGTPLTGLPGAAYSSNLGVAASPATGLTADTAYVMGCGGLANSVLVKTGRATAGAGAFETSTNGTNWTTRTGTGGNNGVVLGAYYCQAGACYLYPVAVSSVNTFMNKTTDGFTQTAVTLPGSVTGACSFVQDNWGNRYAQSSTASIIVMADGSLLRTTDGTNFTRIDLSAAGVTLPGTGCIAFYDTSTSRFVIYVGNSGVMGTSSPMFITSSDNGVTWQNSPAFEDFTSGANFPALSVVGLGMARVSAVDRMVVLCYSASTGAILFDMSGVSLSTPNYVGTIKSHVFTNGGASLAMSYYMRVK